MLGSFGASSFRVGPPPQRSTDAEPPLAWPAPVADPGTGSSPVGQDAEAPEFPDELLTEAAGTTPLAGSDLPEALAVPVADAEGADPSGWTWPAGETLVSARTPEAEPPGAFPPPEPDAQRRVEPWVRIESGPQAPSRARRRLRSAVIVGAAVVVTSGVLYGVMTSGGDEGPRNVAVTASPASATPTGTRPDAVPPGATPSVAPSASTASPKAKRKKRRPPSGARPPSAPPRAPRPAPTRPRTRPKPPDPGPPKGFCPFRGPDGKIIGYVPCPG